MSIRIRRFFVFLTVKSENFSINKSHTPWQNKNATHEERIFDMKKIRYIKFCKAVSALCLVLVVACAVALSSSAASLNVIRFNKRTADSSDAPPIGEGMESGVDNIMDGMESGANDIIDKVESGADNVADGAESIVDGVESDLMDGLDTNIPDSDIGGAVEDHD